MDDSGRGEILRFINKPVNFRPILFCSLSFAAGIFFFVKFAANEFAAVAFLVAFLAVIFLVALQFCLKGRMKAYAITAICCAFFSVVGMFSAGAAFKSYRSGRFESGDYFISGEVESVYENDGKYFVTLRNCKYNGKSGGKFYWRYAPSGMKKYDAVNVVCNAAPATEFDGKGLSNNALHGRAMVSAKVTHYEITGKSNRIYAKFARFTDEILSEGLGKEEYAVARSLLRGDTDEAGDVIDFYRVSGIAHVFAVSGMHVCMLFAAFSFIFKFIPIKKIYKSLAISCLLLFYAYLCGMTPSSVRAAVMCSIYSVVGSFGEKKDRGNTIAFAMVVTLLINPFDLFSEGFILSFSISFAIITLSRPIADKLRFLPSKLRDSLAVLFSASAVAIPLSVIFFGYYPLVSFVTNLLVVPLVSVSFYTLWIGIAISAILPVNRLIALFVPSNILRLTSGLCEVFSNFPLQIKSFPIGFAAAYFIALYFFCELTNTGKRANFVSSCYAVLSVILLAVLSF